MPVRRVGMKASKRVWVGRILSGLAVAFLLFDAAMKVIAIAPVVEATTQLGYSASDVRPIGIVLLLATLLLALTRTAVLGAVFVTAYLGGAVATMVHEGRPMYFPIVIAAIVWIGLVLRRPQLLEVF